MNFGKDFLWGVATASYQIEGATDVDGKQETVWDDFCLQSRKSIDHFGGTVACDHYHRYKEDVELMKNLGVQVYRFSTAMSRVLTYDNSYGNTGVKPAVNQKGLDFYDRLIDCVLEADIDPWMTLYHWDLPLELERMGGFRNREIMYWLADYADLMTRHFGDRVKHFMTLNEMPCILGGYQGWMAPGLTINLREYLNIIHNMLLCHGNMTKVIRANVQDSKIGFAHCGLAPFPASEKPEDIAAFNRAMDCLESAPADYAPQEGSGLFFGSSLQYYCDPIYKGEYPAKAFEIFKDKMPLIKDGDMELISEELDFHGQNVYQGCPIAAGSADGKSSEGFHNIPFGQGKDITAAKWPITPKSLNYFIEYIYNRYKKPVYITENGCSGADLVCLDGKVHDEYRIDFTQRYLEELSKAKEKGADIRGYFHWSLLDNFEWKSGYNERFGIVHVDYQTQKRTPKESYYWYKDLIAQNRK